jgi:hypothetical protein
LTHYDGNYFDPAYALTTLRYRTAALPVYFGKFKRLQSTLLDTRIVAPRVCVLAPSASMRNNFPLGASQTEIYDLFTRNIETKKLQGLFQLVVSTTHRLFPTGYRDAALDIDLEAWFFND